MKNRFGMMAKPAPMAAPKKAAAMPAKMAPKKASGHPHGNLGAFLHPPKKK